MSGEDTEKKPARGRVRIGLDMPHWLPRWAHMPTRIVLGGAIGFLIGVYCIALAMSTDRILWGLETGGRGPDFAADVASLAILIGCAFVVRHALVRREKRSSTDL